MRTEYLNGKRFEYNNGCGTADRGGEASECKRRSMHSVSYSDVFWLFLTGSVIGFVLEGLWHIVKTGTWENHTATVWGPFCIIYGVAGAILYTLYRALSNKHLLVQFIIYSAVGSAVEYFGSLFQELCFGTVSWDYSDHFLNINGRVSLQMTLLWGALGISFAVLVFPYVDKILHKMKGKNWRIATAAMTAFMTVNLVFTACTVWRWGERQQSVPAVNSFEQFMDDEYDDTTMSYIFPNWSFSE